MEAKEPRRPIEHAVERELKTYHPIRRLFLLDIMADRDSRPIFFWAIGILTLGP